MKRIIGNVVGVSDTQPGLPRRQNGILHRKSNLSDWWETPTELFGVRVLTTEKYNQCGFVR